jgi:drug/metabolite transporter (DMT)-like permease
MNSHSRKIHIRSTIALIVAIFMWGSVPLFLRSFIHEIDGWTANGTRYSIAAFLWIGPFIYFLKKRLIKKRWLYLAIVPTITNLFAQSFLAWTVYFMKPGLMMFLARISLLFQCDWFVYFLYG